MLKKLFSTVALASLLVGGLSVSQANAAAPDVALAKVLNPSTSFTFNPPSSTEVVIPSGLETFMLTQPFDFAESFLIAQQGRRLGVSFTMTQPNGNPVLKSTGQSSQPTFFPGLNSGQLSKPMGQAIQADYGTATIQVPLDATGYTGRFYPYFYVESPVGQFLPAGKYTFSIKLTTLGGIEDVPTNATGLTVSPLEFQYNNPGVTFTTPDFLSSAYARGTLCVDSSKVAVGDVVEAKLVFDGTASQFANNFWSTKTGYKSFPDPGYRQRNFSNTVTISQYDLEWGLAVDVNNYLGNLVTGSAHEFAFRLFDQTQEDVSGSCAPAKPAAPTVTVANGMVSANGQFAVGSSANYGSECAVFESTAPTVVVKTTQVNTDWQNRANYSCSLTGLSSGKTYLVKFRDAYYDLYSEYSNATEITIPASGYTVTSTYAGVAEAKKIVKASSNVIPIEDYGLRTSVVADGNGGYFMVGTMSGACPPTCGTAAVRIRHASETALDSAFAGTGSVVINSFSVNNSFVSGMGYYGTGKDKWAVPVNGFNSQIMSGQSQIILGSSTTATTTSKLLSQSDVATVCAAASAGYSTRPNSNMEISVVGAPTNDVLLSITCYKAYTLAGTPSQLALPVLATMDPATGALTFKAAMGTPGANVNNVTARYSVNPNATAGQALVTAFSTSSLVTQVNNFPQTNAGTIADHAVIRLDSSFNVLSTRTSAWATSGGQISADPLMSMPQENTGKIFTIVTTGGTPALVTFDGDAVGAVLPIDTSASDISIPGIAVMAGHAVPSNETVLPVQVTATGKDAAGWIDLTTGALTTGEVLTYTTAAGNGLAKFWLRGSDKNSYLVYSDVAASSNLTVLRWMDIRYVAQAVPVQQIVTVAALAASVRVGDADLALSATVTFSPSNAGTAGAITWTSETPNVCSIIANKARLLTAGTCTVKATAAASGNLLSGSGTQSTTVSAAAVVPVAQIVTVAALAASVRVGDPDLALSATVTFSPSNAGTAGVITWSSETPAVCSIVANKARLLTAGTCTVKATAAASGNLLSGSGTQSTTVSAAAVVAAAQTVTLTGPTRVVVDLDGFGVVSSASSGLPVVYATTTPAICTVTAAGLVVAIAEGTCEITSSQAGNASWLAATKTLTITVAMTPTTPVTEKGDIKKPLALSKTGTFLKNGDTQLGWNRSKGTLTVKLSVVYVGPVKASVSFKVGSKTFTCTSSFGILKKQSSNKLITLTSPNLCTGKTEKTQLAALKKITTSTVVTVTIVRDMYLPTTYKKIRTKTRILYAKLG
jgi:hypothetical protein